MSPVGILTHNEIPRPQFLTASLDLPILDNHVSMMLTQSPRLCPLSPAITISPSYNVIGQPEFFPRWILSPLAPVYRHGSTTTIVAVTVIVTVTTTGPGGIDTLLLELELELELELDDEEEELLLELVSSSLKLAVIIP